MVRIIADEFLTEERDRKYYADHYTCCPPPLFILLITLIEVRKLTVAMGTVRTEMCGEMRLYGASAGTLFKPNER
jgi:hypothetical protein